MKLALDPAYLPDVPLTAAETSHLDALAEAISAEDAPDALTALRRLQQSPSPGLVDLARLHRLGERIGAGCGDAASLIAAGLVPTLVRLIVNAPASVGRRVRRRPLGPADRADVLALPGPPARRRA